MEKFTNTQLIKLAQVAPNLAEQIYNDKKDSEAYMAWNDFQQALTPVTKRGHVDHWNKRKRRYTPMYHYVFFEDVKQHVNNAMNGTGLTWRQIPDAKVPVQTTLLDKRGNPTNQLTVGVAVGIETIIMYKNGTPLSSGYMRTTSTSTSPKDVGSAATYCRRYSLCIATGISSVPDRDGRQRRLQPTRPRQQIMRQRPAPVISGVQQRALIAKINQVANSKGVKPTTLQRYICTVYANHQPIQQLPASQLPKVTNYLTQNA